MTGSLADAEDIVQEAYLRWQGCALSEVHAPRAFLAKLVTRLCLDQLKSARAQRETYVGPWLPEPVLDAAGVTPEGMGELAHDISVALLLALERLSPLERAAFLLHDVFDSDYDEIASALGKSAVACRQIVSRARRRVREERPRVQVSAAARERLVESFMRAIELRDRDALLAIFAEEATLTSDGGGKAKAAHKIVHGGASVVRFLLGVLRAVDDGLALEKIVVNGETGIAVRVDGRLVSVMSLAMDGQRILGVYSVLNPDKLHGVPPAARN
jgi:RNA polymerase sigma-70 factor (ECF subfamily)